jgi:nucleotide-binding universal stress UspA family protein
MEIKKILWATDLSEHAERAEPFVVSLSEKYGSEVHIVYVLEELGPYGAWYGEYDISEAEKLRAMEKEKAEKQLDDICSSSLSNCPLYVRHIAVGDPASEILKIIEKEKPDLAVLGSKGRKARFSLGSVAEKIVRHAPVAVLTVP